MHPNPDTVARYVAAPIEPKKSYYGPGSFKRESYCGHEHDVAFAWAAGALRAIPGATAWVFTTRDREYGPLKTIVCITPPEGHGIGFVGRFFL